MVHQNPHDWVGIGGIDVCSGQEREAPGYNAVEDGASADHGVAVPTYQSRDFADTMMGNR